MVPATLPRFSPPFFLLPFSWKEGFFSPTSAKEFLTSSPLLLGKDLLFLPFFSPPKFSLFPFFFLFFFWEGAMLPLLPLVFSAKQFPPQDFNPAAYFTSPPSSATEGFFLFRGFAACVFAHQFFLFPPPSVVVVFLYIGFWRPALLPFLFFFFPSLLRKVGFFFLLWRK